MTCLEKSDRAGFEQPVPGTPVLAKHPPQEGTNGEEAVSSSRQTNFLGGESHDKTIQAPSVWRLFIHLAGMGAAGLAPARLGQGGSLSLKAAIRT